MKHYKPEWKIYLWKKLLLDQFDAEKLFQPADFVYFDEEERRTEIINQLQKGTDWINAAQTARLGGGKISVPSADSFNLSFDDQYWKAGAKETVRAIIELAEKGQEYVQITGIRLQKNFLNEYREKRKKFLNSQRLKQLASLTMETGGSYADNYGTEKTSQNPYFADRACELPEHIYKKVEAAEELELSELAELTQIVFKDPFEENLYKHIRFKIKIDTPKLKTAMDGYIHDFELGEIVGPVGFQYFAPEIQRKNILVSVQAMVLNFGLKNLQVTPSAVARYGGWSAGAEKHYRFFETLFSLERSGFLKINNLRKSEVIISLVDEKPVTRNPEMEAMGDINRENYDREYNSFGIKRNAAEQPIRSSMVSGFFGNPAPPESDEKPPAVIATENSKKFPHKLPAGTKWMDILIQFLDDENVSIKARSKTEKTNYKEMGFEDRRNGKPNDQWALLRLLAKRQELSWDNSEANSDFKKCKERLGAQLEKYFKIDYDDPFYPYDYSAKSVKKRYSYRTKLTLVPPNQEVEVAKDDISDEVNKIFSEYSTGYE